MATSTDASDDLEILRNRTFDELSVGDRARCYLREEISMNNNSVPPKCHSSILSPQFKYVPAACTNVAATFARVRAERLRAQSGADEAGDSHRRPADTAEPGVEVLEAVWLPGPSRSGAPGNAMQRDGIHLTLLHGRGASNG